MIKYANYLIQIFMYINVNKRNDKIGRKIKVVYLQKTRQLQTILSYKTWYQIKVET